MGYSGTKMDILVVSFVQEPRHREKEGDIQFWTDLSSTPPTAADQAVNPTVRMVIRRDGDLRLQRNFIVGATQTTPTTRLTSPAPCALPTAGKPVTPTALAPIATAAVTSSSAAMVRLGKLANVASSATPTGL